MKEVSLDKEKLAKREMKMKQKKVNWSKKKKI